MESRVKERLREIVGPENYTDSLIDLIAYSKDASEHKHRPEAAVWPIDAAQVSEIMKLANEERFPVVPRGAGTSLAGLAVPQLGGVVLDMCRMDKILEISIEDRTASSSLRIRLAVRSAPWVGMWAPMLAALRGLNTAQQRIMSLPWRLCCLMGESCIPAPGA
jgi:hypothetical protein